MLSEKEVFDMKRAFSEHFGEGGRTFFSPSRINIIGEHIDYNGGKVLPAAIEIGTYAIAKPNDRNELRLVSLNLGHNPVVDLSEIRYEEENGWGNYAAGMAKEIADAGYAIDGADIVVYGNIPNGAGLSSSASLELLIGEVLNRLYNDGKIPMISLVEFGRNCENRFIGVQSGIMDQFAIGMGKKDHVILLDTATMEFEYIPVVLPDHLFIIMNTAKRRELKDSKYNVRRAECEEGLAALQKHVPIQNLTEIAMDEWQALSEYLPSDEIKKRVRHVVTENARVYEMIDAMKAGEVLKMGEILKAGHASLRDDYEVTGAELDSIVRHANEGPHCAGARMVGAGFGGCAIALVEKRGVEEFIAYVGKHYREEIGLEAEFYRSAPGDGTRETEDL